MTQTISVPPATDETILPAGGTFAIYVSSTCNVCFGTASPPGSFPELENKSFLWQYGTTHTFPIPARVGASLPYNTSNPANVCTVTGIADNGKVIVVGSGVLPRKKKSKSKPKKAAVKKPAKKTASKKTASKKAASRTAAKRKVAPKKKSPARKKATRKAVKKGKKTIRRKR
jgi:hypothetical protein